jgi:hypothetical protein
MRSIVFVSIPVVTSVEVVDVLLADSTEVDTSPPPEDDVPVLVVPWANTFEAPARIRRMMLKNA